MFHIFNLDNVDKMDNNPQKMCIDYFQCVKLSISYFLNAFSNIDQAIKTPGIL